jgi:hypothetical protein
MIGCTILLLIWVGSTQLYKTCAVWFVLISIYKRKCCLIGNATTRTSGWIGRGFPRCGATSVSARLSTGLHGWKSAARVSPMKQRRGKRYVPPRNLSGPTLTRACARPRPYHQTLLQTACFWRCATHVVWPMVPKIIRVKRLGVLCESCVKRLCLGLLRLSSSLDHSNTHRSPLTLNETRICGLHAWAWPWPGGPMDSQKGKTGSKRNFYTGKVADLVML